MYFDQGIQMTWEDYEAPSPAPAKRGSNKNIFDHVSPSTPIQETAPITGLLLVPSTKSHAFELYTASEHGTMRKWMLDFSTCATAGAEATVHTSHLAVMQGHSSRINSIRLSSPQCGPEGIRTCCQLHGLPDHQCHLYSASDDRTVVVWDTASHRVVSRISTLATMGCSTPRSIAFTDVHLFMGTSEGTVAAYSIDGKTCHRSDRHECSMREYDDPVPFCVQAVLRQGDNESHAPITSLEVSGPHGSNQKYLFSGSADGTLCIYAVPEAADCLWAFELLATHNMVRRVCILCFAYFASLE